MGTLRNYERFLRWERLELERRWVKPPCLRRIAHGVVFHARSQGNEVYFSVEVEQDSIAMQHRRHCIDEFSVFVDKI